MAKTEPYEVVYANGDRRVKMYSAAGAERLAKRDDVTSVVKQAPEAPKAKQRAKPEDKAATPEAEK